MGPADSSVVGLAPTPSISLEMELRADIPEITLSLRFTTCCSCALRIASPNPLCHLAASSSLSNASVSVSGPDAPAGQLTAGTHRGAEWVGCPGKAHSL